MTPFKYMETAIGSKEPVSEKRHSDRHAAVALIFDAEQGLLMIRRAEREGDPWSGHMGFPGGRIDPVDRDNRAAAERETMEEVGIDLTQAHFLGRLDDIFHPYIQVSAFVYGLPDSVTLSPNEEVDETFWFTLKELDDEAHKGELKKRFYGPLLTFPTVTVQGALIWGISLMFIHDLMDRLTEMR